MEQERLLREEAEERERKALRDVEGERQKATAALEMAKKLAEKLKSLGIEPESLR
jgi:hypothetical protein